MGGISGRNELADYRFTGSRAAIMPSVSVVIPAITKPATFSRTQRSDWGG